MKPLISVIVPFFGVEKYIEKCIKSIQEQTFTQFECILIDDESPDRSFDIALAMIQNDSRFHIIRQKNKGLGGARNTGLEQAKGDYIFFLDSDDYLDPLCLEKLYQKAIKDNADIVVCAYEAVSDTDKTLYIKHHFFEEEVEDKTHILEKFLYFPTAWNKLYRRNLWLDIRYPEKLYFEDLATTYKLVPLLNKISVVSEPLYKYLQRQGSIMTSYKAKNIEDRFLVFDMIKNDLLTEKSPKNKIFTVLGYIYLSHIVYTSLDNIANSSLEFFNKLSLFNELKKKIDKKFLSRENIRISRNKLSNMEYIVSNIYLHSSFLALIICIIKNKVKSILK